MATETIIQNLIRALGQSQPGRRSEALGAHFADVDERSLEDHLVFLKKFSRSVIFNEPDPEPGSPVKHWENFFDYPNDPAAIEAWRAGLGDDTQPHLALLLSFLDIYRRAQGSINQFTGRHLDYYYRDVLRLQSRAAVSDRAHLLLELKKNALATEINTDHHFTAGKDSTGVELIYKPVRKTIIRPARVKELRCAMLDPDLDAIRFAPVANSGDGVGGDLPDGEPKWFGFGHRGLPLAETGFALASPVLRMKEGIRNVTVNMNLSGVAGSGLKTGLQHQAFNVYVSGADSWLGPFPVSPLLTDSSLSFSFELSADDEPVIDYDPEIHGYHFEANAPVLQVQLNDESDVTVGYSRFSALRVGSARITVDVRGVRGLTLENDHGSLNPKKAFQPFGAQPKTGSRFQLACPEALSKRLSSLKLDLKWKIGSNQMADIYKNYPKLVDNDYFTCQVSFSDAGSLHALDKPKALFDSDSASDVQTIGFSTDPGQAKGNVKYKAPLIARSLRHIHSRWARKSLKRIRLTRPMTVPRINVSAEDRAGFITLVLKQSFLHEEYRSTQVRNLMQYARSGGEGGPTILNEPYTPELESLTLSYSASANTAGISDGGETSFSNSDIAYFHLAHSGQMREHHYQREQFDFLSDKTVALLPGCGASGELLIGLEHLQAGDGVSLLFQVAEGSANPQKPLVDLSWLVLCDNYWKPLGAAELVLDTTNQLRRSGLVQVVIPRDATTTNTLLPTGLIWLKAALPPGGSVESANQLIQVAANAVEVEFLDRENDPHHLERALPAGSIKKLKTTISGVGKVVQPYASFGGKARERDPSFRTRVSERLRHKDRALTAWDIERIVLEKFPGIHKVKCIPHSSPDSWLAPGHVMVVLVPQLNNRNAVDPLQPRVDSDTLSRVADFLRSRSGMQVQFHVRNPCYQKVLLDFAVHFKTGNEFNFHAVKLNQAIDRYLSPWAYGEVSDISFGGRLYKSVLLDFIEELEYVDFVTDFSLYTLSGTGQALVDRSEVSPVTPDTILVSAANHLISDYEGNG